jgi:hypothetical protein
MNTITVQNRIHFISNDLYYFEEKNLGYSSKDWTWAGPHKTYNLTRFLF